MGSRGEGRVTVITSAAHNNGWNNKCSPPLVTRYCFPADRYCFFFFGSPASLQHGKRGRALLLVLLVGTRCELGGKTHHDQVGQARTK